MPRRGRDIDADDGHRPARRRREPKLDAAFFVGVAIAAAMAFWAYRDTPPGMPGEPDLRPFEGQPLLVVYGAPWCRDCAGEWQRLAPTLPRGLQVLHLVTSTEDGVGHPATPATARAWADRLSVPSASVLPADLTRKRLPALVLRDATGRWRWEHTGALDADARRALREALAAQGLDVRGRQATPPP